DPATGGWSEPPVRTFWQVSNTQEREAAAKPTAQGMPDVRLNLWYLPPAFFSQAGHGLRPAPGIPCALFI
ncbi:hypothetical protein ACQR1H_11115, partial [Bradyrhizobium sp. HKCCYLRH2015]